MAYTPPSVRVTSIANSRIINISEDVRLPCIVGEGPSVRTVTDYPISRGTYSAVSGSLNFDLLPNSGSVGYISSLRASPYPGAGASYSEWSDHFSTSGSGGGIYWGTETVAGSTGPRVGETYYVSFTYPVPSDQFDPQVFVDSKDVVAFYGDEDSTTNNITTAANMALENGAPAVMCLQVSGSISASTNWNTAFTKLKKKSNIAYLIPITSGSTIQTSALQHCLEESSPDIGHERECVLGANTTVTSVATLIAQADALDNKRAILIAPYTGITRTIASGTELTLDGSYIAAALAGLITAQSKVIDPVTGKIITGFVIPDDQYEPYDMNRMANAGICIMYSKSGVIKVRHAMTTDTTSADTMEISIVSADDMVRRITRDKLTDAYIGKGLVISESTPAAVVATVKAIWNSLVRDSLIDAYGTKNDPSTGEVPISAAQDPNDPTKINVTGSVKFLYPLNYISLEFFIYV